MYICPHCGGQMVNINPPGAVERLVCEECGKDEWGQVVKKR